MLGDELERDEGDVGVVHRLKGLDSLAPNLSCIEAPKPEKIKTGKKAVCCSHPVGFERTVARSTYDTLIGAVQVTIGHQLLDSWQHTSAKLEIQL